MLYGIPTMLLLLLFSYFFVTVRHLIGPQSFLVYFNGIQIFAHGILPFSYSFLLCLIILLEGKEAHYIQSGRFNKVKP